MGACHEGCDFLGKSYCFLSLFFVGIYEIFHRIGTATPYFESIAVPTRVHKACFAFHATLREVDKIVDVQEVYILGDEIAFEVLFCALLAVITGHLRNWTFRIHSATSHRAISFSAFSNQPCSGGLTLIQYYPRLKSRIDKGVRILALLC